ncbi:RNA polymerase-associated protein RapA [Actinobacillus equuli subsp. equuli]|uniref:RNA polymerase-associated protein RapA n=1 Tax=Actinobacillus equuli subsp. equuli TaxID=202947 RepID=A0A9X4G1D9_ACTEU|nr:RNA polymerase-associated protein RapA [Actinobacillus equuli]MDE8033711.1 RNA polymerase-associated protein RapA [Actinobacillus equuli subsp. equuli]MDG4948223.1 RNA polymerase-associated protein RapA [Actinobacillus equuli subsp. haemolyticus]
MFVVGQRWISESENNLGLGIVTASDNRTVTIQFPAAEEERIYALSVAPLTRVQFQKGDRINSVEGWQLDVEEVVENQGFIIYLGKRSDSGEEAVLPEMQLDHKVSFSKPQDRLFSAQIDRSDRFALRYRALQHQQAQFQSPLRGMRGIRASLIPHQLHIAKEVGQRVAPRVLLADEVGLGKTIEAGMILQQQLFSGRVERVLVLVPESLQHQWLVEMLRRFNLKFSLFDEERCADFDKADEDGNDVSENPFDSEALVIASIDWLESSPNRAKQVLASNWDMLIVDEAHHLEWSENEPSVGYQFVECLSKQTPAVLLLTATPEQLGQESHFARLALLDADRFYDYNSFVAEQKDYKPVADAVASLLNDKPLSNEEQNSIAELLSEQDTEPMFKVINSEKSKENDRLQVRQELIRELIDRHGTSRVLFRNTRQGVKGFPHRVYHQITLEMPSQYTNALKVMGMMGGVTKDDQLYPERLFQRMNPAAKWADFDPRIEWLITFLKNHRDEKILVICKQADTAIALEQILREREAIRSAVFHEKMSIVERDRASAYFAQMEEGAQVLISSSIGSEGRNFQFASNLVLFNLPDNPDLLEQSIGRLDRIGQKNDIQIHVPCFENSMQMVLATWYHQGLNAFEETCPMGAALFREFGEELEIFLKNPQAVGFDEFLAKTFKRQQQLKAELEQGRDRLLELNSNGGEAAQALAEAIAKEDNNPHLVNFALSLFDVIGLEQEDLGEQSIVISPTGHMLVPDFPGIAEDGTTVTFDRQLALMREDVEFLTWDHPMIRNGIDLITSGDIGKSAISLLINKNLPAGTLLLEAIYMVETQAPKGLNLTRFLPPTPVRVLLDNKGNDMAAQVSFAGLEKQLKPVNKQMANKIAKMAQADIKKLISISEQKIAAKLPELIKKASQEADSILSAELHRLTSLQAVNKNIRADEIEALEKQRVESLNQIALANWRLDSLRVIVSNKE